MTITTQTRHKLCPCCGADRKVLRESLADEPELMSDTGPLLESENRALARAIINNCSECARVLGGEL